MPSSAGAPRRFLLEIGAEELPPSELATLSSALAQALGKNLEDCGLRYGEITRYESPRRLAASIDALAERQADAISEKLGPPVGDDKARAGFARRCGVESDALHRVDTPKGPRWAWRQKHSGRAASALLPQLVENALSHLPIKRRMRWGSHDHAFARPVRWVVMLLDDEILPYSLFGMRAGRVTRGHRVHADRWIALAHAAAYLDTLREEGYVLACSIEREAAIKKQVQALDALRDGEAELDPALLSEIAALVEWPVALTGEYDERFLTLPETLLFTVMRKHQRCFPVRGANGAPLSRFVTVANLESRDPARVVAGNERVLRPRLADAAFFLQQDSRRPLSSHQDGLHGLAFHARLGSMHDKSLRLGALSAAIAEPLGAGAETARRAGELAKADLVTSVVQELPELQGSIGGHYAKLGGEDEAVATAIAEHYLPRFAGDALPATPAGQAVSLADRIDSLTGILGMDDAPSGSGDPLALRRAALGALRIAVETKRDLDFQALFEFAASQYGAAEWKNDPVASALAFLRARSRGYFQERGFAAEFFLAVREQAAHRPFDMHRRIVALRRFVALPSAAKLIASNKRIANILRSAGHRDHGGSARPARENPWEDAPCEAAELCLRTALAELQADLPELLQKADYSRALQRFAALCEPLESFFGHVLVMTENHAAQRNRLALLSGLHAEFWQLADFGALSPLASGAAR